MAHFTQLNLGSKQSETSATTPRKRAMMMEEKAVLFGALVIICLTSGAVLLTTQGCSRASDQPAVAANQMPQSPAVDPKIAGCQARRLRRLSKRKRKPSVLRS